MTTYRSLSTLGKILESEKWFEIILVTSTPLAKRLDWAIEGIKKLSHSHMKIIMVPDGEKAKDWEVLRKLLVKFTKCHLTKKSLVLAMGGGSVSDLVGFACSIYERGSLSYINIPTTLLAQVDASIGGKTAINFEGYKNLIGSFHKPIAIFLIAEFLKSLNREQLIDGLAEIIKAGIIYDPEILDILSSFKISEFRENPSILDDLISRAIAVKEHFVGKDYKDNGLRQNLNFGHTFGHALELKYGLSHGKGVLLGMMQEMEAIEQLGIKTTEVRIRFAEVLERLGIGLDARSFTVDFNSITHDKKIFGGEISLPVVERIGKVRLVQINLDKLMVAIRKCN